MRIFKAFIVCGVVASALGAVLHLGLGLGESYWPGKGIPAGAWSHWLGIFILSFGLAWATVDIDQRRLKLLIGLFALIEVAALSWVLSLFDIAWSPLPSMVAGGIALLAGFIYAATPGGLRKRRLWEAFGPPGYRLSRTRYRVILNSDDEFDLPNERREATLLVCELLNTGDLASTLSPGDYVALNLAFLEAGKKALLESGGLLDGMGEGRLRAVFGLPLPEEASKTEAGSKRRSPSARANAQSACQAALFLQERLNTFAAEAAKRWKVALDFRIAVEAGQLVGGHVDKSRSFVVMGELLDHTRKLSISNGLFGSQILLGPEAWLLIGQAVEVRPLELVRFEGQKGPEEFYELLAMKGELPPEAAERRDAFWKGVILFRSHRDAEARAHFEGVLQHEGSPCEDRVARYYLTRLAQPDASRQPYDWATARF